LLHFIFLPILSAVVGSLSVLFSREMSDKIIFKIKMVIYKIVGFFLFFVAGISKLSTQYSRKGPFSRGK
jgi:hypothetical protein